MSTRSDVDVAVEGRRLRLSNLDKVFYPSTGFTKGQVIDYYIRVAPALLPHLADRPLTLKRYPNGVTGAFFYEKRCPSHRPDWVRTEAVWSEANQGVIDFCVVDDVATLAWAANLADLELHTYLHRAPAVDRPTMMVFDLDPGPPADVLQCCEVALLLRGLLDRLGLAHAVKSSGSKGLQVYVPLNVEVDYDRTKAFARAAAEHLERTRPDLVVSSMKKALRAGKVLVDWSQNDAHKTTVSVYSLRARERPTVSTPLKWREVEAALGARDGGRLSFEPPDVLARVKRHGDLFAPVLGVRQRLPRADDLAAPRRARTKFRGAAHDALDGAAPPPSLGRNAHRPEPGREGAIGTRRRQAGGGRGGAGTARRPGGKRQAARPATPRGRARRAAGDAYLSTE
jgi:bifunctional non-homologous end joining protein LigD